MSGKHHSVEGMISMPWDNLGQRWRDGRGSFRPADDDYIDTRHYEIAEIGGKGSDTIASAFVEQHHYSHSYVAARFRYGLYDQRLAAGDDKLGKLVGVCVFSQAGGQHVSGYSFPFLDSLEVVTLGRLVLLDYVKRDGESWFVAEAQRRIYHDYGIMGVVSFSDPVPRVADSGEVVMPGHVGCVYQSLNALYTGRSARETVRIFGDDCTSPEPRSLSKIRAWARGAPSRKTVGWEGSVSNLVGHGARAPREDELEGEALLAWLTGALDSTTRKTRHPGKHRYLWGLDKRVKRAMLRHHGFSGKGSAGNPAEYPKVIG